MALFKCRPRYSLRTLLAMTFVTAVVLQASLAARQRQREERRAAFVADVHEQVLFSQRIESPFKPRMLNFVERRVTASPDAALLSPLQQRQLVQLINSERLRTAQMVVHLVVQLADQPEPLEEPAAEPDMDMMAVVHSEDSPW